MANRVIAISSSPKILLQDLLNTASASNLTVGRSYYITDLGMEAIGTGVDSYVFSGVLQLPTGDPVPNGYIGPIVRT